MATIVNNPPSTTNDSRGNGMGFLLGIIILIVVVAIVLIYGLPYLSNFGGTQVNVPKSIDVNLNQTGK